MPIGYRVVLYFVRVLHIFRTKGGQTDEDSPDVVSEINAPKIPLTSKIHYRVVVYVVCCPGASYFSNKRWPA